MRVGASLRKLCATKLVLVGFLYAAEPTSTQNVTATLPSDYYFHELTKLALGHSGRKSAQLNVNLPFFEIYNQAGTLVYHESDRARNTMVLTGLPGTLTGLKIDPAYHATYREMLDIVPAFKSDEGALLAGDRYTVLAVTMEKCSPCAQEDTLTSRLRKDSERLRIRVLQVILQRP